jgi:hypothetical protein
MAVGAAGNVGSGAAAASKCTESFRHDDTLPVVLTKA